MPDSPSLHLHTIETTSGGDALAGGEQFATQLDPSGGSTYSRWVTRSRYGWLKP
jgi:hypothetical protein